ncbi:MAG: DEAD/DEAH box helicase [Chitinophagaceae bacterium]|nr:MAG: DEAD/DEAH box helicase [Chitinophagaceae bacterium]
MELKPYQQKVLSDLNEYLDYVQNDKRYDKAFDRYWAERIGEYNPITGKGMKPYQNSVPGAVHVCMKVPTAGGKTYLACNALGTIFKAYDSIQTKAVVWLVPWSNLLDQTVKNLSDPGHPYRQRLNALFNGRVEVYQKKDLLQGTNFNPMVVGEQLSIFVLSFSSIRAKKKDDRKIYEQNGQLAQFSGMIDQSDILPDTDETALINIIRSFKPVVVVDESHNAESELSTDMLQNLNPSFILDLTATPKDKSNIVSFVNAIELKKEHMVKLPVIVYNHQSRNEVVDSALHLQKRLELLAEQEEKDGGRYIRPIVLFQAQPRTKDDNIDFRKLKSQLLQLGIPDDHIKIKTAEIDELKGVNLMDRSCPVRYIITVNALKEGWDCPFAYILASLADKSSAVDVEQLLGRVLRQPYVIQHQNFQLNLSYVLTASVKFNDTLQNIVKGLQAAGFSKNDYRSKDVLPESERQEQVDPVTSFLFPEQTKPVVTEDEIDPAKVTFDPAAITIDTPTNTTISDIEALAKETSETFEKAVDQQLAGTADPIFIEIPEKVTQYSMRSAVADVAKAIRLPRFFMQIPNANPLFFDTDWEPLNAEALLDGFRLSTKDADIDFESVHSDLYKVDLEEMSKGEYVPKFIQIDDGRVKDPLVDYILAKPKEAQVKDIANTMTALIGDMYPIPDQEIRKYVERVIADMNTEQLQDFLIRKYTYKDKLKRKIKSLSDEHAEKRFNDLLLKEQIRMEYDFQLRESIVPGRLGTDIANSLYEREGEMNGFEAKVITEIGGLSNIVFWHRNLGRSKGFVINGYKSNHYPDFIIVTQKGKKIIIETKGDDRDNSDSEAKNRLGQTWAQHAGPEYRYMMIFDANKLPGTYTLDEAKGIIKAL